MSLEKVSAGRDVPNDINVIIEIPAHSDPVKYEVDKDTGAIVVDRLMPTTMRYPCNYGYVPKTLADDGDPVDVLVITPFPLMIGSVIRSRPVGMLQMTDESGEDTKVLAVPVDKLSKLYQNIKSPQDLSPILLKTIANFFEHYKDLEPEKWVKVGSWLGVEEARKEIIDGVKCYGTKAAVVS